MRVDRRPLTRHECSAASSIDVGNEIDADASTVERSDGYPLLADQFKTGEATGTDRAEISLSAVSSAQELCTCNDSKARV